MKIPVGRYRAWVYLCLLGAITAQAEEEWRTWKSTAGTSIEAKLTSNEG
jgi:hypothetical protein